MLKKHHLNHIKFAICSMFAHALAIGNFHSQKESFGKLSVVMALIKEF